MTITAWQAATEPGRVSPFAGADICREAALVVPPGGHRPRFGDCIWDFTDVEGLPRILSASARRWDFTKILNPVWRLVAMEYLFALMAPGHDRVRIIPAAYRVPRAVGTCSLRVTEITSWLNWLTQEGICRLGDVTSLHCARYLEFRRCQRDEAGALVRELTSGRHLQVISPVIELAYYRELFTTDQYATGFLPWDGKTAAAVAGYRKSPQNKTPAVAPEVLQPLLAAALFVVDVIGPRLASLRTPIAQRGAAQSMPQPQQMSGRIRLAITDALHDHYKRGDPLAEAVPPEVTARLRTGWSPGDPLLKVSLSALARDAGLAMFYHRWLPSLRPCLEEAVARVGVAPPWARRAELVTRAGEAGQVPWSLPMFWLDVRHKTGFAQTACELVIAALSGMRASELLELQIGCRRPPEEVLPGLIRYRLASKVVKGQPPGGAPDEWVVIEEAYRAAGLAEQLATGTAAGSPLFTSGTFFTRYTSFRNWVNGAEGQRLGLAPIPAQPVNLRMLRQTLAKEIAYRPGGLLAAKIALKHVSVATTEGYTARPGGAQGKLLAEIGAHEQERSLEIVLAEYRNYQQGIMPSGPGARELAGYFTSVDQMHATATAPKVAVSDQQLRRLLARRAGVLHLGTANYCWFTDPSRALCLKLAGTPTASKPLIGMCDSARCPQATHHPCHRPVWADTIKNTKAFLGSLSRGQKAERARLEAELARAEQVVTAIDAATSTEITANPASS